MKTRSLAALLTVLGIGIFLPIRGAHATNVTLWWDTNGATSGVGGSGLWDTASTNWSTASTGTTATQVYTNTSPSTITADFESPGGTVTLATGTTICVNSINFGSGAYTINGATGSQIELSAGTGATNSTPLISAAVSGTVNAVLSGTKGLQKGGSSTLTLGGANTFTGDTLIRGGILSISSIGTAGSGPSNLGSLAVGGTATINFGFSGAASAGLLYTGAGETTSRVIASQGLTTGSVLTIQNDGSGALNFTSDFATNDRAITLAFQGSNGGVFSGAIANRSPTGVSGTAAISLTKAGAGTWSLSGSNSYTGTTSVTAGRLIVAGSISGTNNNAGSVTVSGTATIAGTGSLTLASGNRLSVSGTLAPGDPTAGVKTGILTVTETGASQTIAPGAGLGSLNLASGATLSIKLGATTAGGSSAAANAGKDDAVTVNGTISLDGASVLSGSLLTGFTAAANDLFFIVINDGTDAITGTFNGLAQNALVTFTGPGGLTQNFNITYTADSTANGGLGAASGGNDIALIAVPEPATFATLLGGFGILVLAQKLRRRSFGRIRQPSRSL